MTTAQQILQHLASEHDITTQSTDFWPEFWIHVANIPKDTQVDLACKISKSARDEHPALPTDTQERYSRGRREISLQTPLGTLEGEQLTLEDMLRQTDHPAIDDLRAQGIHEYLQDRMSEKQARIHELDEQGYTQKEISAEVGLSDRSVRTNLAKIHEALEDVAENASYAAADVLAESVNKQLPDRATQGTPVPRDVAWAREVVEEMLDWQTMFYMGRLTYRSLGSQRWKQISEDELISAAEAASEKTNKKVSP